MDRRRIAIPLLVWAWFALAAAAADREAAATRFAAGQQALSDGRHAEAEREYRAVLELMPALAEARANLGLVLFLQGNYEGAVAELGRVAAERPDLSVAHLFLGLGHLKLGAPGEAIPSLERSLADDPANLDARRALAACYVAEGDYAGAVREYQAAFPLSPDKAEAWFRLGRDYMRLMSELAGSLVVGRPDSAWASRLGADMLGLSAAWEAASTYYETALRKDPDMPGLHGSAGYALLQLGELEAAERHFRAEIGNDPRSERALLGLVELELARGAAAAAHGLVARVWESHPAWLARATDFPVGRIPLDDAKALLGDLPEAADGASRFLQAALFREAGDFEEARRQRVLLEREIESAPARDGGSRAAAALCGDHLYAACARSLETRPSLARSDLLLLGRAYLALGLEERAAVALTHAMRGSSEQSPEATYWTVRTLQSLADQCFRKVEEVAPDSWRVHQLRAEAHQQRQADAEAVAEYGRALALKPDEPELHRSLGLIHLLNNAHDLAQPSLERALELDPANPRSLYLVGRLHVARQRHEESIGFLERALRLDPNLIEARPSLGRAYLRAGRFEEAAAQLEKGLALDYYGDIHYSLFQAQRRLGNAEAAELALDRSLALRQSSFARDRGKFDRWLKSE